MYPRSGFRSRATCERSLVPVFVPGEHPPKPPFWETVNSRDATVELHVLN